jgi:hypothetical protein
MSTMTLFSWFIKANSHASSKQMNKQGVSATSSTVDLQNGLADELDIFNRNTMWPIAKVRTTTMIIKKPNIKASTSQTMSNTTQTSLTIIPLSH